MGISWPACGLKCCIANYQVHKDRALMPCQNKPDVLRVEEEGGGHRGGKRVRDGGHFQGVRSVHFDLTDISIQSLPTKYCYDLCNYYF